MVTGEGSNDDVVVIVGIVVIGSVSVSVEDVSVRLFAVDFSCLIGVVLIGSRRGGAGAGAPADID